MPACCIATCGARKNKNQPKLTLHRFPKKEPLRKKWLEAIGKVNINTKYREWYVCSLHFNESCFNRTLEVIRLRDDSVPTEFLKRHQDLSDLSESDTIGKGDDDSDDTTTELDPLQISDEETVQKEVEDNEKVKELESKCVKQPKKIKRLNEMIQKRNKKGRKEPAVAIEVLAEPRDSKKRFPQHEKLCRKWLDIIGLDNIKPEQKKPQVCSSHFTRSSFKKTLGVTKLRDDALPSKHLVPSKESHGSVSRIIKKALKRASSKKLQLRSKKKRLDQDCNETDTESFSSEEEMPSTSESLMVCRVCLALDVKMFDMKDLKLTETFQNITGLSVSNEKEDSLHRLCWECTSRLTTASTFRNKALLSDALLKNIASMNKSDIANLRHIYRDSLQSSLTTQSVLHEFDNEEMESNSEEMECVNSEEMECVNSETDFEDDEPLVNLQKDAESEQTGNKNKYIKKKDMEENIEVYKNGNVLSVNEVLSKASLNEDCYLVIVTGDEDSKRKVDEVGNNRNESLSKVITQSLVEASADRAKKVTFKDVGALSEEGNGLNDSEKLKSIASKRKSHSVAERSEETKNSQFGDYECQICKMHFQYRRILNTHMMKHTQRYSCKECTFVTTHRQTATAHARWHKGTKYQCPHCPQQFEHHTTYMGHIRIKHASDFACEICGYSFVSAKGLQQHKNLKHRLIKEEIPEDGPYCEPCNVRFISSEAYTRHIRVSAKHNTDKNSREPNTPKKKVYKSTDKVRTKRVRSSPTSKKDKKKEGLIPCEQCSVQLKGTQAYNIHFRRMHPDKNRTKYPTMRQPSMCELCGRMVSSFQLKYHCCPQNQERPFSCESCGKTFKARSSLHMHQRLHSKERTTYPCSICGKHFSNITNRCRHMFIHTGLKPHKCEICDKNFRTVTEKRAHINYVHLKKPWPKRNRDKRKTDTR